jgi:uncharacterized tellurite resistance protein B-like protein
VNIAGFDIVGGLLYVGTGVPSASGAMVEPALIDPRLPLDMHHPDWNGHGLDYWPSYAAIPPASRAAYLHWLADGRRHPGVPIGYVFLYFYGLERRTFCELWRDRAIAAYELPIIRDEVRRLLSLFGEQSSFRGYATEFAQVLDALIVMGTGIGPVPPAVTEEQTPSLPLRAGLGQFAAHGRPVPPEWALAWIRSHPEYRLRTAATRCAREFDALFRTRYARRHSDGLVVRPGRKEITLAYRPASGGFLDAPTLTLQGIPDVLIQAAATRKLVALADECTSELEAYSRFIARSPEAGASVQAQALLPPELVDLISGEAGHAVGWAQARLGREETAVVPAEEFAALIATPEAKPAKKDVIALARLLGMAGIGVEPDPRLGGAIQLTGPMVLFEAPNGPTAAASDAYRAATLLLHLASAVSAADGEVSDAEQAHLSDHLERSLHLTPDERRRLHAHLRWLLVSKVKLTGLTKRIATMDEKQRAHIAEFLTGVAAADGHISQGEVKILTRIYRLLGLDPGRVHAVLPQIVAPASDPVVVRPAQPETGRAIPAPPAAHPAAGGQLGEPAVRLDQALIAAKLAETAQVGTLLGAIFTEEESSAPPLPPPPATVAPVAGLDAAHSGLLHALAGGTRLPRRQWEELTARWNLLPDGAVDCINEAAYELTGEPLLEGDDPIWINVQLLEEMLP